MQIMSDNYHLTPAGLGISTFACLQIDGSETHLPIWMKSN